MAEKEQKKEFISLKGQTMYDPDNLKEALEELRWLIRELAQTADESKHGVTVSDYADKMFVLNWLIEIIEFKN